MKKKDIILSPEDEKQICDLYSSKISLKALAIKYYGNTNDIFRIKDILIKNNIRIRSIYERNATYSINKDYFNNIDTEEKAYFLGFLYADGTNTGKCITISLKNSDIEILNRFSNLLETNRPIKIYNNGAQYARLSINNYNIINNLVKHGVVERKTFKIRYPDIDPSLDKHFIRGYFDGDGGFSIKKRTNNYMFSITSNREFCTDLQNKFFYYIKKKPAIYDIKNNTVKRLTIGGNKQVIVASNWIYNNATIFLQRKYDLYQNLLKNPISNNTNLLHNL